MNRLGYIGCVVAVPFKVFDAKQDLSVGAHIMRILTHIDHRLSELAGDTAESLDRLLSVLQEQLGFPPEAVQADVAPNTHSASQLREDLAPRFAANCATGKDMPHRDLSRSLGALDTLIEMLQVQVLHSFG